VLVVLVVAFSAFWYVAAGQVTEQFKELSARLPEAWKNFEQKARSTSIGRVAFEQFGSQQQGASAPTTQTTSQPSTQPTTSPAAQPTGLFAQAGGGGESQSDAGGGGSSSTPTGGGAGGPGAAGLGGGGFTSGLLGRFGSFLSSLLDLFAALVVILFTGLFLAFDPKLYVRGVIRLVPPRYRIRAGEVLGALGYTLKWWLIGQGVTMTVIAIATWLGLMIIGVPLAFILGIIAGLFNFIPNFGPLFSMIPATLLALTISPAKAVAVVVMFLVLQNLEGNLLTPMIQRKSVDLPPALGIIAQILLSILVGAVGLMLAWPLAAVVVLAVKMLYVEDVLGDELETPDDKPYLREVRHAKREARSVQRDEKREERGTKE
jgi:predicted PurR-regulated permease PerM